jgi:hypothetical protein
MVVDPRNGNRDDFEMPVSPICDDVRDSEPELFPDARWDCAVRIDADGTIIYLPPRESGMPDEAILLKRTRAAITQRLCLDRECRNLGDPFTEVVECTLAPEYNFDGLVVIRGEDGVDGIFCPNCPSPGAPVNMDCSKAR